MAGNKFVIPIAYKSDKSGLNKAENDLDGFGKSVAKIGGIIAAAFSAAVIIDFAKQTVTAASDLEQSIGGVEAVFKEYASTVEQTSKDAARNLGLSRDAYNKVATIIGTQLKAGGTTLDQLAGKTENLVTIAADLAATFGGDVTDAANAVSSALRKEFEPLRRYGISLSVAQIEAEALANTNKELASDLTEAERAAAIQSLIFKGAADASGQFGREAETLAGKQQRLNAQLENVKATLGETLLPVVAEVTEQFSRFIGELVEKPEFKDFMQALSDVSSDILQSLPAVVDNVLSFGKDSLPAVQEFLPLVNESLALFAEFLLGVEQSKAGENTATFADAMNELAESLRGVTGFIRDLRNAWNSLPEPLKWIIGRISNAINPFAGLNGAALLSFNNPTTNAPAYRDGGIKLAEGGIVMPRPGGVQATIAEAGEAEAVIPLSKMGSLGTTVNIYGNVGYDANELAREIARRQRQTYSLTGVSRLVGVS